MASPVTPPPLRETDLAAQTDVPPQAPACPICQQIDEVRTIQTAFDLGVERLAPPAMPTSNVRMLPWIAAGFFVYLAGNVYLFIELAANSQSSWPMDLQIGSAILCFLALLVGLVLSYLAVLRISRADSEVTAQYPAWDRAMDTWSRLYYCLRDRAVIDPAQQRVLSETELRSLLTTDQQEPREQQALFTHGDIHLPAAEHVPPTQDTES